MPSHDPLPNETPDLFNQDTSRDTEAEIRHYSPNEIIEEVHLSMVEGVGPAVTRRLLNYLGRSAILDASKKDCGWSKGRTETPNVWRAREDYHPDRLIRTLRKRKCQILTPKDVRSLLFYAPSLTRLRFFT